MITFLNNKVSGRTFLRISVDSFFSDTQETIRSYVKDKKTSFQTFFNKIRTERRSLNRRESEDRRQSRLLELIAQGFENQVPGSNPPYCDISRPKSNIVTETCDTFLPETILAMTERDTTAKRERDNPESSYHGITIPQEITFYLNQLPDSERQKIIPLLLQSIKDCEGNEAKISNFIKLQVNNLSGRTGDNRSFVGSEYIPTDGLILSELERLIQRSHTEDEDYASSSERMAIIMGDNNGFKPVNDALGHDSGDKVILQTLLAAKEINLDIEGLEKITFAGFGSGDETMFLVVCKKGYQFSDLRDQIFSGINEYIGKIDFNEHVNPYVLMKHLVDKNPKIEIPNDITEAEFWTNLQYIMSFSLGSCTLKQALETLSEANTIDSNYSPNSIILQLFKVMKIEADQDGLKGKSELKKSVLERLPDNLLMLLNYDTSR